MKDDGGSVYPIDYASNTTPGMSLRDYFAAAALGKLQISIAHAPLTITATDQERVAEYCYGVADAMIAQRTKP